MYTYPIFTIKKTKLRHLNKKWYPGGIQMVHIIVVLYCQNLDKDLNNYDNKLFESRSTAFRFLNVIYVISSFTPYKIE